MAAKLKLGAIGLGRAFTLMLPTFLRHPGVELVAAFDPRPDAVARFAAEFGGNGHGSAEALCADPAVEALYVASPHARHAEHAILAARHGKHVLVEKPMAIDIRECLSMIEAARVARTVLVVGHSHSHDLPYLRAREMIRTGAYGAVRMIHMANFTDFLYRPRRPEELDTASGGGVVFSQAAHQIDVARLLAGSPARTLRARTGRWDRARNTEGAYAAEIAFADGAFASLVYSGYGRYDSDELVGWRGELGQKRDPEDYGAARRRLRAATDPASEAALKASRAYGAVGREAFAAGADLTHNHFGQVVVCCERADLRPVPQGIHIFADEQRDFVALPPPEVPRAEVVDEFLEAIAQGTPPLHSGEWGLATLEACRAILDSAASGSEIALRHQI